MPAAYLLLIKWLFDGNGYHMASIVRYCHTSRDLRQALIETALPLEQTDEAMAQTRQLVPGEILEYRGQYTIVRVLFGD